MQHRIIISKLTGIFAFGSEDWEAEHFFCSSENHRMKKVTGNYDFRISRVTHDGCFNAGQKFVALPKPH